MSRLESGETPYYSYSTFVCWLEVGDETNGLETMRNVAHRLLEINKGNPVYLADHRAFSAENLDEEFPELGIFDLDRSKEFVESTVAPGIWIESASFARLRALSGMRREIRARGLDKSRIRDATSLVATLLGLNA